MTTTCPECGAEVAADQRFCSQCGARQPAPTERAQQAPEERAAPATATVVLPALPESPVTQRLEPAPTQRLEPQVPQQEASSGGMFGLPGAGAAEPAAPAAGPYAVPPVMPAPAADARPSEPAWAPAPTGPFTVPPTPAGATPPAQGKSRWGLIIGILVGLAVLACVAVVAGLAALAWFTNSVAEQAQINPIMSTAEALIATAEPGAGEGEGEGAGAVLINDAFDGSGDSGLTEGPADGAEFTFDQETYTIAVDRADWLVWDIADGVYDDVAIEVDATVEGAADGGSVILFRYQDQDNFYAFYVFGDGSYLLQKYVGNEPIDLVELSDSAAINGLGQSNRLRVEMQGETIRLYVNGELLAETTDTSFSGGELAFGASTQSETGLTVRFDNLTVSGAP